VLSSVSACEEQSAPISAMPQPVTVNGRTLDYMASEEINRLKLALPFYETARAEQLKLMNKVYKMLIILMKR